MPTIDTGDTAWVLASAALVMFMTPGLALFYGGLVRSKNVLGTVMESFIALAVVAVVWFVAGYGVAFGRDVGLLIGMPSGLGVPGADAVAFAPTVPGAAFAAFQMMFAVITPALIAGAFAERMRFGAYVAFIALWSLLVYAPIAHWVWGGGFLGANGIGALDFAGGTVVHISAGAAALATVLFLGKRRGYPTQAFIPHNVPMVVLGAGILWFGWFGFNAGSALGANGLAASAFVTTHLGAAGALIGWLVVERVRHGKATTVGAATGAVAGLVAITPAAGFVGPLPALLIGLVTGVVCCLGVGLKGRLGYDDSLDVVGVHLVGGVAGALLTGVFATLAINPAGADGGLVQLGRQAIAVGVTFAFSFVATLLILKAIDLVIRVRVTAEEEDAGLDISEHGEVGYSFRERSPRRGRVAVELTDAELQALREELVLEAAARVLLEVRTGGTNEADPVGGPTNPFA